MDASLSLNKARTSTRILDCTPFFFEANDRSLPLVKGSEKFTPQMLQELIPPNYLSDTILDYSMG
jgi:hypothetical protein